MFGLKKNGSIIGTIQSIFKDGDNAELHHARVLERERGQGYGTLLMQAVEQEAKKRGFKVVTLSVDEHNIGAYNLYLRNGYREAGRKKGDHGEPLIEMMKNL